MNQCILHNNLYIPNLLLFLVLVSIILYYVYVVNFQKNVETFIDGCYTFEQNDMKVAMRKCGVYFVESEKEKQCDEYFQYYDMTDVQIDYTIYEVENTRNEELLGKLNDIRDYLQKNNYNKCTIDYTNAKELKQYFDDKYQPDTQNYIYPTKNINTFKNQVNYKLWNSCFINASNLDYLSFNDTVIESCTRPLTRIIDVNDSENKYLTFSFNPSINYNDVYNSICDKGKDKDILLNIINNKPFLSYKCEYKTKIPLKIYDSSLISYDATVRNFVEISIANRQELQNMINNLFRLSYSRSRKRVVYGPRKLSMNVYLIYFDLCKNIRNYSIKNIDFSLRDFNVDDDIVNVPITNVPELIDVFDKNIKDNNIDTQQLMIKLIGDLIQDIENETKQIEVKKNETEKEKEELTKKMIENAAKLKNDNFYQSYIDKIINLRNQTDIFIYQYTNSIKTLRTEIDVEFNRQKALIGSSLSAQEINLRNSFNTRLNNENSKLLTLGNQLNNKIDIEYNKTIENLTNIYITVVDRIRSYFKKNIYCSINFYNTGLFLTYTPRLEYEFTCMLINMPIKESIVDILDTTKNPTFHTNKYILDKKDIQYYVFELSGNILLDEGYYYFYIDVLNDEATDVFLGYPNPNNDEGMIFKNVANYYYANPNNGFDYRTRKDANIPRQNVSTARNKTTDKPIYINGEYNNGYYGIYIRSLREIETLQSDYINIKYVRMTTKNTNTAYDLFKDTFSYRTVNSINISSGKNIRDQLYTYSDLSTLNNISAYYKINKQLITENINTNQPGLKFNIYNTGYYNNDNFKKGEIISYGNTNSIINLFQGINNYQITNIKSTTVAIEWSGYFLPNISGQWTFHAYNYKDQSWLWVGDTDYNKYLNKNIKNVDVIIDGYQHKETYGTIYLEKGIFYPFRVIHNYTNQDNIMLQNVIRIHWTSPDSIKRDEGKGYFFTTNKQYSSIITKATKDTYGVLYKESDFLQHVWNFERDLRDRVQNLIFTNNTNNNAEISYNTQIVAAGIRSLTINSRSDVNKNNYKLSANVNLSSSFSLSFWMNATTPINRVNNLPNTSNIIRTEIIRTNREYLGVSPSRLKNTLYRVELIDQYNSNFITTEVDYVGGSYVTSNYTDKLYIFNNNTYTGFNNIITSLGENIYVQYENIPKCTRVCGYICYRCTCSTICTYNSQNQYLIKFMPFVDSIYAEFNKWYHIAITYNNNVKTMYLYIDGVLQKQINITFTSTNLPLRLFNSLKSSNNNIFYNDIRIHSKELTPFEVYCLYYKIVCPDTNPDPGIRKLEKKFYIACPKLPKPSEPPKKPTIKISYTPLTLPTILNAISDSSYIPIYTQEKRNLNNFYNVDDLIDQLDDFRKLAFDDYNCMMKAEKQVLTNSITQQSIDNKKAVINRIEQQIVANNDRITTLNSIANSIRDFNRNYDYNRIKGAARNILIEFNTDTYYRYFGSVFKNVKNNTHHIYVELV